MPTCGPSRRRSAAPRPPPTAAPGSASSAEGVHPLWHGCKARLSSLCTTALPCFWGLLPAPHCTPHKEVQARGPPHMPMPGSSQAAQPVTACARLWRLTACPLPFDARWRMHSPPMSCDRPCANMQVLLRVHLTQDDCAAGGVRARRTARAPHQAAARHQAGLARAAVQGGGGSLVEVCRDVSCCEQVIPSSSVMGCLHIVAPLCYASADAVIAECRVEHTFN